MFHKAKEGGTITVPRGHCVELRTFEQACEKRYKIRRA
jgi:hypothetical protein